MIIGYDSFIPATYWKLIRCVLTFDTIFVDCHIWFPLSLDCKCPESAAAQLWCLWRRGDMKEADDTQFRSVWLIRKFKRTSYLSLICFFYSCWNNVVIKVGLSLFLAVKQKHSSPSNKTFTGQCLKVGKQIYLKVNVKQSNSCKYFIQLCQICGVSGWILIQCFILF